MMKVYQCRRCEGTHLRAIKERDGRTERITHRVCTTCGAIHFIENQGSKKRDRALTKMMREHAERDPDWNSPERQAEREAERTPEEKQQRKEMDEQRKEMDVKFAEMAATLQAQAEADGYESHQAQIDERWEKGDFQKAAIVVEKDSNNRHPAILALDCLSGLLETYDLTFEDLNSIITKSRAWDDIQKSLNNGQPHETAIMFASALIPDTDHWMDNCPISDILWSPGTE